MCVETERVIPSKMIPREDQYCNIKRVDSTCIGKVMRTFGWTPSEEELKDLVNVIDVDGNGDISFNEFVWLMTK